MKEGPRRQSKTDAETRDRTRHPRTFGPARSRPRSPARSAPHLQAPAPPPDPVRSPPAAASAEATRGKTADEQRRRRVGGRGRSGRCFPRGALGRRTPQPAPARTRRGTTRGSPVALRDGAAGSGGRADPRARRRAPCPGLRTSAGPPASTPALPGLARAGPRALGCGRRGHPPDGAVQSVRGLGGRAGTWGVGTPPRRGRTGASHTVPTDGPPEARAGLSHGGRARSAASAPLPPSAAAAAPRGAAPAAREDGPPGDTGAAPDTAPRLTPAEAPGRAPGGSVGG